jgi:arabinan endo-1,5-alpha-L-arabinosidase
LDNLGILKNIITDHARIGIGLVRQHQWGDMLTGRLVFRVTVAIGICASCVVLPSAAATAAGGYVNPLKGDLGVHDPVMIRQGNVYHIYCTGANIGAKTSADRITWKNAASGLPSPSWIKTYVPGNNGTDFWAPDISFRDSLYWLYYSVSTFGSSVSAIGLATSPTLGSPVWTDKGMVIRSQSNSNYNCIDPNAFTDADGKTYLLFGSFWSGIKMVETDPATGKPASASPTLLSLASRSSGIEAPFMLKWGAYYYLFVSWDKCCNGCTSTYKMAVGRASNVKGPFVDKAGKAMTAGGGEIIDTGDAVRKGPGHNGLFIENDTVFCVNHYYACNSLLQIRPLYFDNGWPSFTGSRTTAVQNSIATGGVRSAAARQRVVFASAPVVIGAGERVYTIAGREITKLRAERDRITGIAIVRLAR